MPMFNVPVMITIEAESAEAAQYRVLNKALTGEIHHAVVLNQHGLSSEGVLPILPANTFHRQSDAQIAYRLVADILAAGYSINVWDSEDWALERRSTDAGEVMAALAATDEETVHFYKDGKAVGWVYFVYGNDVGELIADYSANPATEEIIKGAEEIANQLTEHPDRFVP